VWEFQVAKPGAHQSEQVEGVELLDLVGDIYQAGLEAERWPAVIARMSQAFRADLACIYTPFPARPEQSLYLTHNFTGDIESAYSQYYHHIDAWTDHALRQRRYIQGTVALGEELIPQRDLRQTEFYNDFLKPNDMEWMVTTALFDGKLEGTATHMTFTRHHGRAAYDDDGKRLIDLLAPHVRRALLTHWRLTEARLGAHAGETALEHLGYGVILLDGAGAVLYLNPMAEAMLRRGDGLTLKTDRLGARQPADDHELTRLIRQACLGIGSGLFIERNPGSGGRIPPYQLSLTPARGDSETAIHGHRLLTTPPRALILVTDPDHPRAEAALRAFATRYRITAAELRVLQRLLEDLSPKEIAERLNSGVRTVRSQLSSLFTKTGTRNQRELVAMVLRQERGNP
jgi:DNA-binding CsgD family transcriptional regulator/PAS domain-containing protein